MKFLRLGLLSLVAFLVSSGCGFDAGYLNDNSSVSKQRRKNIEQYEKNIRQSELLDDNAVEWFGNYCETMTYFKENLDQGENQGENLANVVQQRYIALFETNTQVALITGKSILNYPAATYNTEKWKMYSKRIYDIFKHISDRSVMYKNEIAAINYTDTNLLQITLNDTLKKWSSLLKSLNKDISEEIAKLPFVNQKTASAAQKLSQCKQLQSNSNKNKTGK